MLRPVAGRVLPPAGPPHPPPLSLLLRQGEDERSGLEERDVCGAGGAGVREVRHIPAGQTEGRGSQGSRDILHPSLH